MSLNVNFISLAVERNQNLAQNIFKFGLIVFKYWLTDRTTGLIHQLQIHRLTDRLTDCLTDWLSDWLIVWKTGCLSACLLNRLTAQWYAGLLVSFGPTGPVIEINRTTDLFNNEWTENWTNLD